jgi:hypothetical protein
MTPWRKLGFRLVASLPGGVTGEHLGRLHLL